MIQGKFRVGKTKVDSFILGEVIVDRTGKPGVYPITVHFALANSKAETLFGKTTKVAEWSDETLRRLGEFLESVENDIAADLFDGPLATNEEGSSNLPVGESGIPEL